MRKSLIDTRGEEERRRRKKEEEEEKEGIERGSREKLEEEKEEERNHFPISLSKSSSVFAQCVNESSVKPFLFRKSNIYACSTDAFKRSLCTVSFPNR